MPQFDRMVLSCQRQCRIALGKQQQTSGVLSCCRHSGRPKGRGDLLELRDVLCN